MKTAPWLAFLVLFVHSLSAFAPMPVPQVRPAPIQGAAIQGWTYDAPTHTVNVRILNTGNKDITAYILDVTETDAAWPSEYHTLRDFLNNTVFLERIKGAANEESLKKYVTAESIPAGGSFDEKLAVAPTFKTIDLKLEAVAFSDQTAQALSKEPFEQLAASRKATIAAIDKAIEVINSSATLAEAEANMQKTYDAYQATNHTSLDDMDPGELLSIVDHLKQLPVSGSSEKDALAQYVALKQRERSIFAAQSNLKLEVTQ
jgi:hypothetical protein